MTDKVKKEPNVINRDELTLEDLKALQKEIHEREKQQRADKEEKVKELLREGGRTYPELIEKLKEEQLVNVNVKDPSIRQYIAVVKSKLVKAGEEIEVKRCTTGERSKPIPSAERIVEAFRANRFKEIETADLAELSKLITAELDSRKNQAEQDISQ